MNESNRVNAARQQNRADFIARLEEDLGEELHEEDRAYAWRLATTTTKTYSTILHHAKNWLHEQKRVASLEARGAGYGDAARIDH